MLSNRVGFRLTLLSAIVLSGLGYHAVAQEVPPTGRPQCVKVHCSCDPWNVYHECSFDCRRHCGGSASDDAYNQLGDAIANLLTRAVKSLFSRRRSPEVKSRSEDVPAPTPARPNPEYERALSWLRAHQLPPERAHYFLNQAIRSQQNSIAGYQTTNIKQQLSLAVCLAQEAARKTDSAANFEDAQWLLYGAGQALQGSYVVGPDADCRLPNSSPPASSEKYALLLEKTRALFERVSQREKDLDTARAQLAECNMGVQQWGKRIEELKAKATPPQSFAEKQTTESVLKEALEAYDQALKSRQETEGTISRYKQEYSTLMTQAQTAASRLEAAAKDPSELDKALAAFEK